MESETYNRASQAVDGSPTPCLSSPMTTGLASRIPVEFEGEGGGTGELSWGQREMWGNIHRQVNTQLTLAGVVPLPPETTVESVAASFGFLLGRHQSLRTRIRVDAAGRLQQVVAERGETHLEVVDADGADPTGVAEIVHVRLRDTRFDFAQDWPVRMAVVRDKGILTHIVTAFSHLAVDGAGVDVLVADLVNRDPDTGCARRPVTALQPLDQARRQSLPGQRRQSDAALRYWERILRTAPAHRFAEGSGRSDGGIVVAHFSSPAMSAALRTLGTRHQVSTASVLLAGYAVALATVTGRDPSVVQVLVGNRFRPGLAESVSTLSQAGLCVIDVAGVGFGEVIRRAWQAATKAYKYAYYDSTHRDELIESLGRERGEQFDLSCIVNDLRAPDAETLDGDGWDLPALVPDSRLDWLDVPNPPDERLFISFTDQPYPGLAAAPDSVCVMVHANTRFISTSDVESCLRRIETTLVEAALDTK
ncbi:MAG TPA: condensation domain-containing protein [Pseudonocardiaceae bacterium]|nr:condensation domain-containing protein [Pseudonocardiaceae bacterium]